MDSDECHAHTCYKWKQSKYLVSHLSTILSFYSSFGFAHVQRGVIHPKVNRKSVRLFTRLSQQFITVWQEFAKSDTHPKKSACSMNCLSCKCGILSSITAPLLLLLLLLLDCLLFRKPAHGTAEGGRDDARCVSSGGASLQTDVYSSLSSSCHFANRRCCG